MTTIDNLDFVNYKRFATDQEDYEVFKKDLRVDSPQLIESNYISKQVEVIGQKPAVPELIGLFGADIKRTWANFEPPEGFFEQRSLNQYIVSSLGPPSYQERDIVKLEGFLHDISKQMRELVAQKKKLPAQEFREAFEELKQTKQEGLKLLRTIYKGILATNQMVDFVQGRMMQYLQG